MDENWVIAYILLFYILFAVLEKPKKRKGGHGGLIVNQGLPVEPVTKPLPPIKDKTVCADGFEEESK